MIAKTVLGASFVGALRYGAGEGQASKKAKLLICNNVIETSPDQMAGQMHSIAERSRCKRPVWHTSLSWSSEENVSESQMRQAARLYCEAIGAHLQKHQVVAYRHFDQAHAHVHIYINRVPIGGGVALDTSHNYAQNMKVCRAIENQLGFEPLAFKRHSVADVAPEIVVSRQTVKNTLTEGLVERKIDSIAELQKFLANSGIESRFKYDTNDRLVGCSFRVNDIAVTGTEAGFRARQVAHLLTENQPLPSFQRKVDSPSIQYTYEGYIPFNAKVFETNADLKKIEKSLRETEQQLKNTRQAVKKLKKNNRTAKKTRQQF